MTARKLKVLEYKKDYALAGKKRGDKIKLYSIPHHLRDYLKEVGESEPEDELLDEFPTEKWNKADIVEWLQEQGEDVPEGTKAELLEIVEQYKSAE